MSRPTQDAHWRPPAAGRSGPADRGPGSETGTSSAPATTTASSASVWRGARDGAGSMSGSGSASGPGTDSGSAQTPAATPTTDARMPTAGQAAVVTVNASKIGRFTLLGQIGQGGMGSVFAAYDEQLDRRVALKLLHQSLAGTQRQRQRTLREAQAAARVSHPNIISVYEVGETGEHIYIAMEYVDGETLHTWQARGPHDWRERLEMYLEAGAGLHAAHAAGVVHCDFKAENVLVSQDGRVRVVDFGLARINHTQEQVAAAASAPELPQSKAMLTRSSGRHTVPGAVAGTPGYMPLEQVLGGNVDSQSDQWSFCAALFESLYGYLPFATEAPHEPAKELRGPPRPPPRDTKVPEEVHRALLRGLSTKPSERFPSMAELLEALTLEHGDHAGGGVLFRTQVLRWLVGLCALVIVLVQIRQSHRTLVIGDMIMASGTIFTAILGAGIYRWRTLSNSRFNRSLWLVCLVTILENLFQRIITQKLGLPLPWLFPFEMIVLAANVALAALLLIRSLFWLPIVPLIAAGLAVSELVSMRILSLTYLFTIVAFAVGWQRAATARIRQPASAPRVSGAFPVARPQRTPTYSPLLPSANSNPRPTPPLPRSRPEPPSTPEAPR